MVGLNFVAGLMLSAAAIMVAAEPAPVPTAAPNLEEAALEKRSACTFTAYTAATKSKTSCSTIVLSSIAVPSGKTLDMTGLTKGTTVIFEGTTTFGYKEWSGPLISFSGTDITIKGASGHEINGNGAKWWDGGGSNSGKTKPKFFYAHSLKQSTITGLNIVNTPVQCFSINSAEDLTISDVTIDNSDGDTLDSDGDALGHNTDAFDVGSSSYVTIDGATVYNQDDCLAINSGSYITFSNGYCSGGHGLSIGSVGGRSNNVVENIWISGSTVTKSQNGVRIKTVYDATGSVSNVTYKDITLSSITKYGIVIEQDYENGSPTGTPTDGVPITDLTLNKVTGTVKSTATNKYILCAEGACSDWTWTSVSVTGGKTSTKCSNVPDDITC
ncbi:MAG: Polygalacturonase 2 [Cirrosporium novae-zelandiae]|nr:MAG: Polygalacturonase 2 [Cirrosporium novae-zelandiae]